ncbi:MAG: divalent metal cation transporter [Candidatus Margulisiibacteriota bacterium]
MKHLSFWRVRLLLFFSILGPGIITGTADNDAGGIATYSIAGAHFGYQLLWLLILITFMLYVTQEMGARLGVVTGKGLGDLVRENFGLRLASLLMLLMFVANFANIFADVVGIAAVADIYSLPRMIFVPIMVALIWYIILKGSYNFVHNVFLSSCILFFCYIINGLIARPDVPAMLAGSVIPVVQFNREFIFTATALIGTTLTVWGQFFVQSYFVDKGVEKKDLKNARLDVFLGAFWTDFVAYFIIISAAATLFVNKIRIESATDAARALGPLLGPFAKHLFSWGLLNASMLGVSVIAMGTAYAITEILGTERKVNASFREAPLFYSIIGFCLLASVLLLFIPQLPVMLILTASQALNTVLLPVIFVALIKLLNDKKLMGNYVNNLASNVVAWITVIFFTLISLTMLFLMLFR